MVLFRSLGAQKDLVEQRGTLTSEGLHRTYNHSSQETEI
jgi:hypothetical protein